MMRAATPAVAPAAPVRTLPVLGTPLCVSDYSAFTAFCQELAAESSCHAVDFTNTHIVVLRRHDSRFRELTGALDYFVPDGMPLIWCLNRRGAGMKDRVYGPTFLRHCVTSTPDSFTHYFLGGSEECVAKLVAAFRAANSKVNIVGAHHGYFQPGDEEGIVAEINRLSPDFIWLGLGTPKQQEWIARNKPRIRRGVLLAVGFAFDVNAGTKPDAPVWMQRLGLTWAFRLASEPRRLAWRYLKYNSLYLWYLLHDSLVRPKAVEGPAK
jgi:N-acetylglucosaminyldiphosphoundecaprenol N-acetyl-beta-D-mannosaminyltransferase